MMNEEPKVSKRITRKLERYLNRERVEQRFDASGQGLYRTHPLVVKLELAYLIASEDQKKQNEKKQSKEDGNPGDGKPQADKPSDQVTMPKVRSLPQKKTRVQMSEVDRLAKTANTTLKTIDANKISTVYRFRQQMVPYQMKHQGKVKQVSTNVHAMLNAEEAWRYRRENDEREKVKKYKEQQKAKAKELAAQEAKERELAKLPPGIRMEMKRQQGKQPTKVLLEKLMETSTDQTSQSSPSPRSTVPMATEDDFADGEESEYEDDFEEDDDDDDSGGGGGGNEEKVEQVEEEENREIKEDCIRDDMSVSTDSRNDDALIAAVNNANDAGSINSFAPSSLTAAPSPSLSSRRSRADDGMSRDEAEAAYEDEVFESDTESNVDDQSVFMTDVNPESLSGSRSNSRASSPTKSRKLRIDDDTKLDEEMTNDSVANLEDSKKVRDQAEERRPGSAEVKSLANQLAQTVVRSAAAEEGVSCSSSTHSIRSRSAGLQRKEEDERKSYPKKKEKVEERPKKTQDYVRTESVVSLSDRVKKDSKQ